MNQQVSNPIKGSLSTLGTFPRSHFSLTPSLPPYQGKVNKQASFMAGSTVREGSIFVLGAFPEGTSSNLTLNDLLYYINTTLFVPPSYLQRVSVRVHGCVGA